MPTILKNNIKLGGKTPTNIQLGGKDVKYAKLGSTVVYDTLSYYSYNTPSITFTYPSGNVSASGGSKTPSARTWSQTYYAVGHSGAQYGPYTTSGTVSSFSVVSGSSYGTLNTSTGVFTFNNNTTTSQRTVTIRASVTANGKSTTKDVSITQSGLAKYTATIIWDEWDLNLQTSWMLCTGTPTYNGTSNYFCYSTGTGTESWASGMGITVNAAGGGATTTVADKGLVTAYHWSPSLGKWRLIGSFTHQAYKSYTVNLP